MNKNDEQLEREQLSYLPHEEQIPENSQIIRSTTKETIVKPEEIEVNYFLQKSFVLV